MINLRQRGRRIIPRWKGFVVPLSATGAATSIGVLKIARTVRAGPPGSLRNDDFATPEQAGVQRKCARSQEYDGHGHDGRKNRRQPGIKQIRRRRRQNREPDAQGAQAHHHAGGGCENPARSAPPAAKPSTPASQDRRRPHFARDRTRPQSMLPGRRLPAATTGLPQAIHPETRKIDVAGGLSSVFFVILQTQLYIRVGDTAAKGIPIAWNFCVPLSCY